MRELNKSVATPTYETFKKAIEHESPEICANTMITLIKIATYLLKQQLKQLEAAFVQKGGLRERKNDKRQARRKEKEAMISSWDLRATGDNVAFTP